MDTTVAEQVNTFQLLLETDVMREQFDALITAVYEDGRTAGFSAGLMENVAGEPEGGA